MKARAPSRLNSLKVSATLRDRLRANCLTFVVFMKNPTNYAFFGSLIIPENDFIFKKRQKFNMFGKYMSSNTGLQILGSSPSRNKENKTINPAISS